MKQEPRAIILLQYLKEPAAFIFTSPVTEALEQAKRPDDVLFSVDTYSDSITSHYAMQAIQKSNQTVLVCDLQDAERLGAHQVILNACRKKKNLTLISLGAAPIIKPFISMMNGTIITKPDDLIELLNQH